jgi:hypothetical protein
MREVQYRRRDDWVSAAQPDVGHTQPGDADKENHRQLGPVSYSENDCNEVASAVRPHDQKWDRKQEGELRDGHEVERAQRPSRERGKRRLDGHENRGSDRVIGPEAIVDRAARTHPLHHRTMPLRIARPATLVGAPALKSANRKC